MLKIKRLNQATLVFGATDTSKEVAVNTIGLDRVNDQAITHTLDLSVPNFTNSVTATVAIVSEGGTTLYSLASLAKNTKHAIAAEWPINSGAKFTVTLSGVPGGAGGSVTLSVTVVKNA